MTAIKPPQEKRKRRDGGARCYGGKPDLFSSPRLSTIVHISSKSEDRTDVPSKQLDPTARRVLLTIEIASSVYKDSDASLSSYSFNGSNLFHAPSSLDVTN